MLKKKLKICVLIPTLNAGEKWIRLINSIKIQTVEISKKIIVDSGSTDKTVILAEQNGFEVLKIDRKKFDHGGTRQLLANHASQADILIYITQDCILASEKSIEYLIDSFKDEKVAISYGRQLPHDGAKLLESHARFFNYPNTSKVKSFNDVKIWGIKTASCSNSFSAYKKQALLRVGGFPINNIFGEDVVVGGKLILLNYKIAYVAEAIAYHSHDYTPLEEFKRFFDVGVFHKTNEWLLKEFGTADSEGFKYVKSEIKTVLKNDVFLLPKMLLSTLGKFIGYKMGLNYKRFPLKLCKHLSMNKSYWERLVSSENNKL